MGTTDHHSAQCIRKWLPHLRWRWNHLCWFCPGVSGCEPILRVVHY
ncbi:Uncharacterised protein [Vibrio cholerae]|nr:Uncharacterised protein [Vibrio cholerae]